MDSQSTSSSLQVGVSGTSVMFPRLRLLDGEYSTNIVEPMSYALARRRGGGGEFDGALHITNFRLALQRTGPGEMIGSYGIDRYPKSNTTLLGPALEGAMIGVSDSTLEWVSFPLACIKTVNQAEEDPLAITIIAKDLRSCRLRFPCNNEVFVATLAQIILSMSSFAQTSPERSFAIAHATAVARRREEEASDAPELVKEDETPDLEAVFSQAHDASSTRQRRSSGSKCRIVRKPVLDGWEAYDEEAEFVRLGIIRPKSLDTPRRRHGPEGETPPPVITHLAERPEEPRWRLFHNRSHALVPTYPLHIVVPAAMSDADVRAVAAYRCKGRLPAVTWMDPETKAVLARSAQPLAGLGGNSCPEDERLLGFLQRKGYPKEEPQGILSPEPAPSAATDSKFRSPVPTRRRGKSTPRVPIDEHGSRSRGFRMNLRGSEGSSGRGVGEGVSGKSTPGHGRVKSTPSRRRRDPSKVSGSDLSRASSEKPTGKDPGATLLELMGIKQWGSGWVPAAEADPHGDHDRGRTKEKVRRMSRRKGRPEEESEGTREGVAGVGAGDRDDGLLSANSEDAPGTGSRRAMRWRIGGARYDDAAEGYDASEAEMGPEEPHLCVLDARTAVAALGNQLVGKGVETVLGTTRLVFSGIGNTHAVRDAFEELRNAMDPLRARATDRLKDESTLGYLPDVVSRGLGLMQALDLRQALGEEMEDPPEFRLWPKLLRQVLGAGVLAARLLRLTGCSVLVHCSDGWDRTPQVCSTAQLLLDPYYRTLEGFCVLIEKEWLSFGHKFWARCMGGSNENSQGNVVNRPGLAGLSFGSAGLVREYEELSPVFLQFMDVVYNVMTQFPNAFEFTDELLAFIADHVTSGLFGTFLSDTERRRNRLKLKERTVSIWTVVLPNKGRFTHPDYQETRQPLWPSLAPHKIRLWERQHCRSPELRPQVALGGQAWQDGVSLALRLIEDDESTDERDGRACASAELNSA